MAENPHNLDAHCIVEISLILRSAYVIPRDQKRIVFHVNNYFDWDQFNQLYDLDWIEKGIQNADAVACKLKPALTKTTNLRRKEVRKSKKW